MHKCKCKKMSHPCIHVFSTAHPDLVMSLDTVTFSIGPGLLVSLECHWVTSVFPSRPGNLTWSHTTLIAMPHRSVTDITCPYTGSRPHKHKHRQQTQVGLWLSYGIDDDAVVLTENNEYLLDSCQIVFKARILIQPMKLPFRFSYLSTAIWQCV